MKKKFLVLFVLITFVGCATFAYAQKGKRPPSPVTVSKVTEGEMMPQSDFIGTVYFSETSNVASEVSGKVVALKVIDGQQVKKGEPLIVLSSSILQRAIENAEALAQQAKSEYEYAALEHKRVASLFQSKSVAEGEFDAKRLTAEGLHSQYQARLATLAQLREEYAKKTIRAPYDGIVLDVAAHRGEWMSVGSIVAVTARNAQYEVVVNAPREAFGVVKPGLKVTVRIAGQEIEGEVFAVIPRGDVATRTFPVKIRVTNNGNLAEGMEARVSLPRGLGGQTMIIHRDALVPLQGKQGIWVALEGKAVAMPVQVIGYKGMTVGVKSPKLKAGMDVIIKGNERLRPGQDIAPQSSNQQ